jgi:high-affinity Fe2+/Pb2+ permease
MPINSDDLERAKLAVEEYKVLHAELLHRNTILIQILAAGVAAIVALIVAMTTEKVSLPISWGLGLIILVVLFVLGTWKFVDSDARNASKRIIEIEEYVNKAVGGNDKMPLSWERRFGILKRDYADRFRRFDYDAR